MRLFRPGTWILLLSIAGGLGTARADEGTSVDPGEPDVDVEIQATPAKDPDPPTEVRLVPVMDLTVDVRSAMKARERFHQLTPDGDADDYVIFSVLDMGIIETDEKEIPSPDAHASVEYRIYGSMPIIGPVFDIILPHGQATVLKQLEDAGDDEANEELGDGAYRIDGALAVSTTDRTVLRMIDHNAMTVADSVNDLRRLLIDEDRRPSRTLDITASPAEIGRSLLKPHLAGWRASMLTHAQERDNNDVDRFEGLWRTITLRSGIAAADAFFKDTEHVGFSFHYEEDDQSSEVVLRVDTRKGSEADRYLERMGQVRNQAISFLHPDHDGFMSAAVPLPQLITDSLPELVRTGMAEVAVSIGLPDTASQGFASLFDEIVHRQQVDLLLQFVPTSPDTGVVLLVIPTETATAMEPSAIQLISRLVDDRWETSVDNVAGWPVHRFPDEAKEFSGITGPDAVLHLVMTDQCIAFAVAPRDSLDVVEAVVTREFGSAPEAGRFARCALSASWSSRLWARLTEEDLPGDIRERLSDDPEATVEDSISFYLQSQPESLTLRADFQRDALLDSQLPVELLISVLEETVFQWLGE